MNGAEKETFRTERNRTRSGQVRSARSNTGTQRNRPRSMSRQEARRRQIAARRRKIQRRRNIAKLVIFFLALFVTVKLISIVKKPSSHETDVKKTVEVTKKEITTAPEYLIEAPVKLERQEALAILKKLAKENKIIQEIYENEESYPKQYLSAVANNPEMAEFVKGYLTANGTVQGGIRKAEKNKEYPLFIQWDQRWGYVQYGDSNIGIAGCGPTCLSMVIYALTRNEEVTPNVVAKYSQENGYYIEGTGTSWSLMTEGAEHFGVQVHEVSLSEAVMQKELERGNVIICAVGPGDFTTEGHFIVLYGYDAKGFLVNDPNCRYRSSLTWSYEKLESQIKNMWAYAKGEEESYE